MSRPHLFLLFSGLFASLFASCQRYEELSADAFLERLGQEADAQLVDVRTPEEFADGHLPGAINIDWLEDAFMDQAKAQLDPAKPVLVYCRSGRRSAAAAKKLAGSGYAVTDLLGGFQAWVDAGNLALKGEDDAAEAQYAATLLTPGTPAPDFTLIDLEGNLISLSDFRGRSVVLVFWASWCPDCRAEVHLLKQMAAEADPAKVQMVSVSFDREFKTLIDYVAEQELPGVQLFEPSGKADSAVGAAFGVRWIPSLYLIDPEGNVVFGTILAQKVQAALRAYPARLLALDPDAPAPAAADSAAGASGSTASGAASRQPCEDDTCEL